MKIVILTSDQLRHKFFINFLQQRHNIVGVVMEEKKRDVFKKQWEAPLAEKVRDYFSQREKSEKEFFGKFEKINLPPEKILYIKGGQLNEDFVVEKIKTWQPDVLVVFGSSLLKKEFIAVVPQNRIINMHLGLSPYYRGSGTNFWPLYNEEPQFVGVTVHFINKSIDAGDIIVQARPNIAAGDTPHSIGNKAILLGAELLSQVLKKLEQGRKIKGAKQKLKQGKLYLFDDCKAQHIVELMEKWDRILADYVAKKNKLPPVG